MSAPPRVSSPLFTIDETCEYLRLSRSSVYTLFSTGQLPRLKMGNRVVVHKEDIDKYLDGIRGAEPKRLRRVKRVKVVEP